MMKAWPPPQIRAFARLEVLLEVLSSASHKWYFMYLYLYNEKLVL